MLNSSGDKIQFSFSSNEQKIFSLYKEEFNDLFQDILNFPSEKFTSMIFKRVSLSLRKNDIVYSKQTLNKIEKFLIDIYYPTEYKNTFHSMYQLKKKFYSLSPIGQSSFIYNNNNYIKHCNNTKEPIHSCGKLLLLNKPITQAQNETPMLFCFKCNQVYKSNFIKLSCSYCNNCEYYSSIIKEDDSNSKELQPATWVRYHCNAVINDTMKCIKCKNVLYINQVEEKLYCKKCDISKNFFDVKWKCCICGKDFYTEAKVYNPLDFKLTKIAVNDALINKVIAYPETPLKCGCVSDIKNSSFYHKLSCKGEMYIGTLNAKKILVCSKCYSFNYYDSFNWTCPICHQRRGNEPIIKDSKKRRILSQETPSVKELIDSSKICDTSIGISGMISKLKKMKIRPNLNDRFRTPFLSRMQSKNVSPLKSNEKKEYLNISASANKENDRKIANIINLSIDKENDSNHKITPVKKVDVFEVNKRNLFKNFLYEPTHTQPNVALSTEIETEKEKETLMQDFEANEYEIKSLIGEGTFGKIYLVQKNWKKYAMKRISGTTFRELEALKKEYNILNIISKKRNINIIPIYGIQIKHLDRTTYVMYILMELAETDWEKEINKRAKKNNYYKEEELIKNIKNVVRILALLQKENISHRDIKPQNFLICKGGVLKITDFGEAKELIKNKEHTEKQTLRGTELFMSPLLFKALRERKGTVVKHNSYKSDVFSLGLCFLFACTLSLNSIYEIREIDNTFEIENKLKKIIQKSYSSKILNLLMIMLRYNEKERYDFIELEKYVKDNF